MDNPSNPGNDDRRRKSNFDRAKQFNPRGASQAAKGAGRQAAGQLGGAAVGAGIGAAAKGTTGAIKGAAKSAPGAAATLGGSMVAGGLAGGAKGALEGGIEGAKRGRKIGKKGADMANKRAERAGKRKRRRKQERGRLDKLFRGEQPEPEEGGKQGIEEKVARFLLRKVAKQQVKIMTIIFVLVGVFFTAVVGLVLIMMAPILLPFYIIGSFFT